VTGLSPEVAQTLVAIGVDLSKVRTLGDLQSGIDEAVRLLDRVNGTKAHDPRQ
jgi:rsbT co-antagonist protein RsbR